MQADFQRRLLSLSFAHGSEGPFSREHFHGIIVTVSIPVTMDMRTGLIPDLTGELNELLGPWEGRSLSEIPGIFPTVPSFALWVRERLLLKYPECTVTVKVVPQDYEADPRISVRVP